MTEDFIKTRLGIMLERYKKLGLTDSPLYNDLEQKSLDQGWINDLTVMLDKVENSEEIFYINKEITEVKNDQRVAEMFSEIDSARWLVSGSIDGAYDKISYLKKNQDFKLPDFLAIRGKESYAVETKMLSPQDVEEGRFVVRMINKINKEAISQLRSFFKQRSFTKGLIFMWSHELIHLEKIDYFKLDKLLKQKIEKQDFPTGIYMTLYRYGLWDFEI